MLSLYNIGRVSLHFDTAIKPTHSNKLSSLDQGQAASRVKKFLFIDNFRSMELFR